MQHVPILLNQVAGRGSIRRHTNPECGKWSAGIRHISVSKLGRANRGRYADMHLRSQTLHGLKAEELAELLNRIGDGHTETNQAESVNHDAPLEAIS